VSLWLPALRHRATADACVPTIESSLTPAGAVAFVPQARHRLTPSCYLFRLRERHRACVAVVAKPPNSHAHARMHGVAKTSPLAAESIFSRAFTDVCAQTKPSRLPVSVPSCAPPCLFPVVVKPPACTRVRVRAWRRKALPLSRYSQRRAVHALA
jgi:hypothetical protein